MNQQLNFRALLIKIQDILSDKDRQRLHFLMGENIPRYLQDDPSLKRTLTIFQALLDKSIISHEDFNYLIEAFETIHCYDAAKLLKGLLFFFLPLVFIIFLLFSDHQLIQEQNSERRMSILDILLDTDED